MKKTYKDFGDALDTLRVQADLSYDRLSLGLGIANSYVYHMINRRTKNAPSDEIIKKIADYFHLEPEYFYEYRLRRMLEFLDSNREFLDHCEKESKKYSKDSPTPPVKKEKPKKATKDDTEETA
jgi:transcriptional regulator with XRE-family HTH domain